jgi:ABC-type Fe3+/spermidine/putrescine transport system ATPase subunit
LQQIGSPRDLYETPETEFVAGFIGETNFWPGMAKEAAVAGAPIAVELDGGGTAHATAAAAIVAGSRVSLAVRPERVRMDVKGMPATVQEAIYAGTVTTLLLQTGGPMMRVRVQAGTGVAEPAPGTATFLSWRKEEARVFPAAA